MPEKLDRCVKKLMRKGYSEDAAWAICKAALKKSKSEAEESDEEFDERIDRLVDDLGQL